MKNGKAVAIAIAILSLLATSAYGQQLMQADIPFEFHAAGKLIPAGTYVLGGNETFHWLHLRQSDGRTRLFLSGRFAGVPRGSGSPVMIFHRYGERYFLRSVDIPGRNARYTLPASTAEREIAKVTRNTIQVASIRTLSK